MIVLAKGLVLAVAIVIVGWLIMVLARFVRFAWALRGKW